MTGGTLTITSAVTPTTIPGAFFTVVPHINCRASIPLEVDAECTVAGTSVLIAQLLVNGSPQTLQLLFKSSVTGVRLGLTKVWQVDMAAGGSYTFSAQAILDVAGDTFLIYAAHTALGPMVVMPHLTQ